MKRFILISFGFLAWAFYEMSGGSNFVPRSAQMAQLQTAPATETADATPAPAAKNPVVADTDPTPASPDDGATRLALNLTSIREAVDESVTSDPAPSPEPEVVAPAAVTDDIQPEEDNGADQGDFGVPRNPVSEVGSGDTPAVIPSLINPNDGVTDTPQSADGDIRIVAANRVNVRGGPGTNYEVIDQLGEGARVRVVMDNGDGWVKFQPLDGGPEGWMADFLLSSG